MVKACISALILLQLWLSPTRSAAQALRGRADVDVDEHDVDAKAQHSIDEDVTSAVSELDEDLAIEYLDSSQITRQMRTDIGLADFISLMAGEDEKAQHILYSVDDNASELDDEDEGIVDDTSEPSIRQTSAIEGLNSIEDAHDNSTSGAAIDQYHRRENFEVFQYHKRIIGGRDATQTPHPFVVSLRDRDGNHYCGGTLISKDCVLTAAHCSHEVTKKGPITVVIDRLTQSNKKEGEELQVRDERLHPKYDVAKANVEWEFDFALLFLEKPTVTMAQIIELNSNPNIPRGGGLVRVYGWGDTAPAENVRIPSDVLQVATLRTVSNQLCDQITGRYGQYSVSYTGFIRDSMMCAKNKKRDSCQGDSGGPMTFRGMQVGITSWGVGCNNRSFPGVYARISSAYGWIRRNVCSRSMYPDRKFGCEPW